MKAFRRRWILALAVLAAAPVMAGEALAQSGGSWQTRAPMPTPRRLLAAAAVGGKIYTLGGCGSPCFNPPFHTSTLEETRVEVYDPTAETWTVEGVMPTILFGAAAAAPGNGRIYTFGGQVSSNVVQEYHPVTETWTLKAPMPTPRYGLAVVAWNGRLYAIGGNGPSGALERYDPATDTWTSLAPMPTPRVFLAAAVADGQIYAVGGSPDCCGDSQTAVVERYDPATDSWTGVAPLPVAQQVSAAVGADGKVITFGGFTPGVGARNATFEYDPGTDVWTQLSSMPTARDQAPAVFVDSRAFVIGGSIDCHCQPLAANEVFTPPGEPELEAADLSITKMDSPDPVGVGSELNYTLDVSNGGPDSASAVQVIDTLPPDVGFIDATGPGWACTHADGVVTCSRPSLPRGDAPPITIEVIAPATPGVITNTATVTSETDDPDDTNNSTTETTTVESEPAADLEIAKTDSSDPIDAGGEFTYTLMVENDGPNLATSVEVTDTLPPGVDFIDAAGPGWACTQAGGVVTCTRPALASGDPTSISIEVVAPPTPGVITNAADVTSETQDPDLTNNSTTETTTVEAAADLEITKTDSSDPIDAGCEFTYTLVVENDGPNLATSVEVTDTLPPGVGFLGATGPGWACAHAGGVVTCTRPSLAPGDPTSISIEVVAPPTPGVITNAATVTSETKDPDLANNSTTETTTVEPAADLEITKTDSSDPIDAGCEFSYTLIVENDGPNLATSVEVIDTLPPGVGFIDATGPGWACAHAGGVVTCARPSLPPGDPTSISIEVVAPATPGEITNAATVTSETKDPDDTNNSTTETTTVEPAADLEIKKTNQEGGDGDDGDDDEVYVCEPVTYRIAVENLGPNAALGAEITDDFPPVLGVVAWDCPACTPAAGTGQLACSADLLPGDAVTCTATGIVDPGAAGTLSNTAWVTPPAAVKDPDDGNNHATDEDPIRKRNPIVTVTKEGTPSTVFIGDELTFTIEVTNSGTDGVAGVAVTDDFPGDLLIDVQWTCVPEGAATCAANGEDDIEEAVDLPAGSRVTFTATGIVEPWARDEICNTVDVELPDPPACYEDPAASNSTATTCVQVPPDCNRNHVDDAIDVSSGNSRDVNDDGIPDECQIGEVDWTLTGLAEGGSVVATIEGIPELSFETCVVAIVTTAGESPATVAANLAAALDADACLDPQSFHAMAMGSGVWMSGFLLSYSRASLEIDDPGLDYEVPILKIPTLSEWGLGLMALLLAAAGVVSMARREAG